MLKKYKSLPWPLNLWSAVFQKEVTAKDLPSDWEQALEHVFTQIRTNKRKEIILYFFRDGMTLQEISDIYGTTKESVRQHAEKAIRMIRHPSIKIYLFIGFENGKIALSEKRKRESEAEANAAIEARKAFNNKIDALGLSVRAWNSLRRGGIETIDQLTSQTEREIAMFRNMGVKSLDEIKESLAARGLSLRAEEDS